MFGALLCMETFNSIYEHAFSMGPLNEVNGSIESFCLQKPPNNLGLRGFAPRFALSFNPRSFEIVTIRICIYFCVLLPSYRERSRASGCDR